MKRCTLNYIYSTIIRIDKIRRKQHCNQHVFPEYELLVLKETREVIYILQSTTDLKY